MIWATQQRCESGGGSSRMLYSAKELPIITKLQREEEEEEEEDEGAGRFQWRRMMFE
jgi:hypothetical protein